MIVRMYRVQVWRNAIDIHTEQDSRGHKVLGALSPEHAAEQVFAERKANGTGRLGEYFEVTLAD